MDFKFFGNSPFKRFTHGKSFKSLKDSGPLPTSGGKYTSNSEAANGLEGRLAAMTVKHPRTGFHKSRTLPNMGKKGARSAVKAGACHVLHIGENSAVGTGSKVALGESGLKHRWASRGNDLGVVHENTRIGSDGESEDVSGTSDEKDYQHSPVKLRQPRHRRTNEDIKKRLSLPADMSLPDHFLAKQTISPTLDGPINRRLRRASLSEIGFGKIESYAKLNKLGEGTYATVFKGKSLLTDNLVALKEIRLEHEEGAPCTAIREVSLLRDLKHANIVTLHDIIHTQHTLTLVFEYLEKDLKQYMDDCGNIMNMNNVKLFLFQLLRGLAYCHKRRVLHRDIKPQNLLISDRGDLKLADFGLARAKSIPTKTYSNEVVTLWYRPPDVLLGSTEYSTQIDMWGVGCIFYEMACGRPLFPGSTVEEELQLIFKTLGTPTEETWPGLSKNEEFASYSFPYYEREQLIHYAPRLDLVATDLLAQFLQYDAHKRISAAEAMKHKYFESLGPGVHKLPDTTSIFTLPGISLQKDPGLRSSGVAATRTKQSKQRRQSMLF